MIRGVIECVWTQFSLQKCRVEEAVNMSHSMITTAVKETEYKDRKSKKQDYRYDEESQENGRARKLALK